MTVSVTNARSLLPKLESLYNTLVELDSDIAIVSETWLKDDPRVNQTLLDLEDRKKVSIIRRDRGNGKQAGGVAICYKSENIEMRAVKMPATEFEVLCSIGRRMGQRRKILVIAIYIPPSYNADKNKAVLSYICDLVLIMKNRYQNPHIVIGGDINNRNLRSALSDYRDCLLYTSPSPRD